MSKAKHTPGPWTFDEHGGSFYVYGPEQAMLADNDDEGGFVPSEVIARMRGTGRGASDEEKQANARLIAAAPELLDVAEEAFELLGTSSSDHARAMFMIKLHALIEKAKGEQ